MGTIVRHDRVETPDDRTSGNICDGCRELSQRVTRLEQALEKLEPTVSAEPLSTTMCYWICVAVHALCALLMYCNELLVQSAIMMSIGAVATLVVNQVLSTRPVHLRNARSLLAASIVVTAALLGMWLGDVAAPSDMMPYVWMLLPPLFACGWIVAKIFVWSRRWKIIPPGAATGYPPLRIHHLMLCTLLMALYLAVNRRIIEDVEAWFGDSLMVLAVYLCLPMVACTVVSCLLAHIILAGRARRAILQSLALALGALVCMAVTCLALMASFNDGVLDWEALSVFMLMYGLPLTIGVFCSSGGTFALMRAANYRFACQGAEPA